MSFTGDFVDAEEALRIGLVNHVVPHQDLLATAHRLATAVTSNQHAQVVAMKELYQQGSRIPFGEAFDLELELAAHRRRTGGTRVARSAVVERGRLQVRR